MHLNHQHYMASTVRQPFWSLDVVVIRSCQRCACIAVHLRASPGPKDKRGRAHVGNSRLVLLQADLMLCGSGVNIMLQIASASVRLTLCQVSSLSVACGEHEGGPMVLGGGAARAA